MTDFVSLLRVLVERDVEFVVVGGVAAVLHGAPVATIDLDLVHSRSTANVDRLLVALGAVEARYRVQGKTERSPGRSHLASAGHQLLVTRYGPLDLLGEVGTGRCYEDLRPHCVQLGIGEGLAVPVLDLKTLISLKRETGREKDLAMLPVLQRTLAERES